MDHMLLPKNPSRPMTRVPYIGKARYDGGPFLSYPARLLGKSSIASLPDDDPDFEWRGLDDVLAEEDQLPFLQTWLLFGLVCEFLQSFDIAGTAAENTVNLVYSISVEEHADGKFVTTRSLFADTLYQAWSNYKEHATPEQHVTTFSHLFRCLRVVRPRLYRPSSDPVVRSLRSVADYLGFELNAELKACNPPVQQPLDNFVKGYIDDSDPICESMMSHGWCPSEILKLSMGYHNSFQTLHFLSHMDRSCSPDRSHSRCSKRRCMAYQIQPETYVVGHWAETCNETCQVVEVKNEQTVPILEKGSYPLIRLELDAEGGLSVNVVEWSKEEQYIAISHVWADGLGNPHATALLACQLRRLFQLLRGFLPTSDRSEQESQTAPLMWLDTLCCPVRPEEAKILSIQKMADVYRNASHVLVLDRTLQQHNIRELEAIEAMARIYTSAWMSRLWTLQEGALTFSLNFQFADTFINLKLLLNLFFSQMCTSLGPLGLMHDLLAESRRLAQFFQLGFSNSIRHKLGLFDETLRYRSASVLADEPVCLSTLLVLSIDQNFSTMDREERMKSVWRKIGEEEGGVPSQIIFLEGTKMRQPGWRWAFLSFMSDEEPPFRYFRYHQWLKSARGVLSPDGLQVRYRGFKLRRKTISCTPMQEGLTKLPTATHYFCTVANGVTMWHRLIEKGHIRADRDGVWEAWNAQHKNELSTLLSSDRGAVIILDVMDNGGEGLGVEITNERQAGSERELLVRGQHQLLYYQLGPQHALLCETTEKIAMKANEEDAAKRLAEMSGTEDPGYAAAKQNLDARIQALTEEAYNDVPGYKHTVAMVYGKKGLDVFWTVVRVWLQTDLIAESLPADQLWCVT